VAFLAMSLRNPAYPLPRPVLGDSGPATESTVPTVPGVAILVGTLVGS
jgi:hypothetical protein